MFYLISTAVLGALSVGGAWYAIRRREYRLLLMVGFLLTVIYFGVVVERFAHGLAEPVGVFAAQRVLYLGFALEYVYGFLVFRDMYRKSVANYNARKLGKTD
jgi:hypothetical protein